MNIIEQAQVIREAMDYAGANLTEETALACVHLYRPWAVGVAYKVDEYLTYGANDVGDPQLYKVVQAHTSQSDWTPDSVPALFTQNSVLIILDREPMLLTESRPIVLSVSVRWKLSEISSLLPLGKQVANMVSVWTDE